MEPCPNSDKRILLAPTDQLSLYQQCNASCAGALAHTVAACAAVSQALHESVPVGLVIDAPSDLDALAAPDEEEPHPTDALIALCKQSIPISMPEGIDFLYLRGAGSFAALRCLVLAATDITGRSLTAEISVEEDGLMPHGTDSIAAVGVLQRIGVSTIVLSARTPEDLNDALERVAPYARVSLGARADPAWLKGDLPFRGAELFVPRRAEDAQALLCALEARGGVKSAPREYGDFLLAPDDTNAHFIHPTIDISDEIPLDARLTERLLEAEDEAGALKLELRDEEDLIRFEEQMFMLTRPICLCAEQPELLEHALRIYPGRAIYDGTWELEPRLVKYFSEKYGMIPL